jgi:hypothetical protein
LTNNELATMLAALRHWQRSVSLPDRFFNEHEAFFAEHHPLTDEEIDALCERLNTSQEIHEIDLGKHGDGEAIGITAERAAELQASGVIVTRQRISTYALTNPDDQDAIRRILDGD